MIYLKTDEEIELMRVSNQIVAKTLGEIAKVIKPGVSTLELDKIAEAFIRDNGGTPAFLNYQGFPNTLCTSMNEHVVHGIPNDKPLKEGDVVSVDCGVLAEAPDTLRWLRLEMLNVTGGDLRRLSHSSCASALQILSLMHNYALEDQHLESCLPHFEHL